MIPQPLSLHAAPVLSFVPWDASRCQWAADASDRTSAQRKTGEVQSKFLRPFWSKTREKTTRVFQELKQRLSYFCLNPLGKQAGCSIKDLKNSWVLEPQGLDLKPTDVRDLRWFNFTFRVGFKSSHQECWTI